MRNNRRDICTGAFHKQFAFRIVWREIGIYLAYSMIVFKSIYRYFDMNSMVLFDGEPNLAIISVFSINYNHNVSTFCSNQILCPRALSPEAQSKLKSAMQEPASFSSNTGSMHALPFLNSEGLTEIYTIWIIY